ncbi:MAG: hypothetical protein JY451_05075 [Erythrobacter sp.]|nr:MAG: hypothetical protein JY451_05075 [Erythrobacter sp.]
MIQPLALGAILIAALWLGLVAVIMALSPQVAVRSLAAMGSTRAIHFGEHVPRALVGAAMILRAVESKAPLLFELGGWFLVASSIVIMVAPRQWHNHYSAWWAERIPPWVFRALALPTLLLGGGLAYLAT